MAIVNQGNWCQVGVSTGATGVRAATKALRSLGYRVSTSSMGLQVTDVGLLKMTMISVNKGSNEDTFAVTDILRAHISEIR